MRFPTYKSNTSTTTSAFPSASGARWERRKTLSSPSPLSMSWPPLPEKTLSNSVATCSPKPHATKECWSSPEKGDWGKPLPQGHFRGIAVAFSYGSYASEVAEVSIEKDGKVRVHRVVCAIDCGIFVNPDTVKAQVEGSIVWGMTAALYGAITIDKGRVQQSNFHDYPMLRMNEMPAVEVHIVPSNEPAGGVGEPGVPPLAPAVCNAIFAGTGKRIRKLPILAEELRSS